jgi:hypothetical protein
MNLRFGRNSLLRELPKTILKADREEFAFRLLEAEIRGALHFTPKVQPLRKDNRNEALRGFYAHKGSMEIRPSITEGESDLHFYRLDRDGKRLGGSHAHTPLYPDRVTALRALRNEKEEEAAIELLSIDRAIEAEIEAMEEAGNGG